MYDCSVQHAPLAHKFTGKERDSESGLDNFGARYDSSQYGRFMSPDWSGKPQGVPYAKFDDPQSLNLYSYVENNPVSGIDMDGHENCHDCRAVLDAISRGLSTSDALVAVHQGAQQNNAPHPYVAPTGPGTEIGNILNAANPSNPGPITSPTDPLGQCVTACRHYEQGLPDHTQWTKGVPVVITENGKLTINPAVKAGTAIATFVDGHYPGDGDLHKNSGVFLGPALIGPAGSIRILDQWPGSPGPRPRDVSPTGGSGSWDRSNHSTAYYVIMAP
jgi:RHS repeat-associated protein